MQKKLAAKYNQPGSEFTPPDSTGSVAEHTPAGKRAEKSVRSAVRQKDTGIMAHSPTPGARVTPTYIERTPAMWAVGEVDIKAISDDSLTANFAFAFASFLLGLAINILVTYEGMEKLSETGALMLHKVAPILAIVSLFFYVVGFVMTYRKNAIWAQIKRESKVAPANK
jgi:hypothetical protein